MAFRYALCNETFVELPLERGFELIRQFGYDGVEIAPFTIATDVREITSGQREEIRRLAEANGLEIVGLHWLLAKTSGLHLTSDERQTQRRTTAYIEELARLCRDLGGRVLVFGSPQQRNLSDGMGPARGMEIAAEVIGRAIQTIQQCDIVLAVEPLGPEEGNFLLTAAEAVELIQRVDSPHCRLHLDCKAMSSESTPIPQLLQTHASRLEHFHANDPNRQGPGFGDLDFAPILRTLQEIGYDGWVSVEVFDYSPGPERLASESIEYLKKCESRAAGE